MPGALPFGEEAGANFGWFLRDDGRHGAGSMVEEVLSSAYTDQQPLDTVDALVAPFYSPRHPGWRMFREINLTWEMPN